MRPNWISKCVASVVVCGFLLGVSAASAAPAHPSKPKGMVGVIHSHFSKPKGHVQDKQAFITSLANDGTSSSGSCESTCCYAWFADCSGGSADCSNTGCSWSCDGVGGGYYPCDAI